MPTCSKNLRTLQDCVFPLIKWRWLLIFQYRTKTTPIVKANKAQSESTTRRIIIYGVQDENGSNIQNFALDITPPPEVIYKSEPGTSEGMNVLGIVIFSATMGMFF